MSPRFRAENAEPDGPTPPTTTSRGAELEVRAGDDLDFDLDDPGVDDFDGSHPHAPEADDDDVVYISDEPGVVRRAWAVAVFMVLFLFGVLGLGGYWLFTQVNPAGSADGSGQTVSVVIPPDSGLSTIARLLEENGVVTNGTIFRYYARLRDVGTIRPGEYDKLRRRDSMDHVIARLNAGPTATKYVNVTIPEGWWAKETADRVKEKFPAMNELEIVQAMKAVRSRFQPADAPVDGFLFPDTYRLEEKDWDNEVKLIEQMTTRFDAIAAEIGLADAAARLDGAAGATPVTPYEVLKVAALVESEAKVPADRARIARVIYNRMKKGMKLEIDATVPAAMGQRNADIAANLQFDSPYNLRRNPGLTPTPINSPGRASLEAALAPSVEEGADRWIFYVIADKAGGHAFSDNIKAFEVDRRKAVAAGLL